MQWRRRQLLRRRLASNTTELKERRRDRWRSFALVVVLWVGFAALLFVSQSSIDDAWTWFKDHERGRGSRSIDEERRPGSFPTNPFLGRGRLLGF